MARGRAATLPPVRRTLLLAVGALLFAGAAAPASAAPLLPRPPSLSQAWVARVLAPVSARIGPALSARQIVALQPTAPLGRGPQVLLVTAARRVAGVQWVRLRLPIRPNGSHGWVPASALRFNRTALRIVIDQSDRRLTLYRGGRTIHRARVAIGQAVTPTPNGRFAIAEMIRTNTPGAFLGPIVFPLTGYSETLNEYAGGDGRVAIHGTSLPWLIGTRASHGCIRLANADIVRLSRLVRPGVPVLIRS
jgi:lipoprotein-anchoring transpeptidase ErfK/SrfK